MKKAILILLFTLFTTQLLFSQISIREEKIVEKPFLKPSAFDSLTNIVQQRNVIDYKKYIGYKLYFLPKSNKFKPHTGMPKKFIDYLYTDDTLVITKDGKIPFEEVTVNKMSFSEPQKLFGKALQQYKEKREQYENIDKEETNIYKPKFYHRKTDKTLGEIYGDIATSPDSVSGKYFTILDIKGKEPYSKKGEEYKSLEDVEIDDDRLWQLKMKIVLKNDFNNDTLYWLVNKARFIDNYPFMLVPYFEKQRNLYLNKNLVLKDKNSRNTNLENLVDVNTGEVVKIVYGDVWTCTDVSLVESKNSYYLSSFLFLENNGREVKIDLESNLVRDYFILETEFREQELEKQKNQEQKLKEQKELELRRKQVHEKFIQDCIAKWGNDLGGLIANGKVKLGMNKEMCTAAWGNPININSTIVKGLVSEQWVYGWGTYLYFDNNILTAIQN